MVVVGKVDQVSKALLAENCSSSLEVGRAVLVASTALTGWSGGSNSTIWATGSFVCKLPLLLPCTAPLALLLDVGSAAPLPP